MSETSAVVSLSVAGAVNPPQPLVGVVVIVRDAEETIRGLLDSLRGGFDMVVDELVIVDTGSTDDTKEVIRDWLGEFLSGRSIPEWPSSDVKGVELVSDDGRIVLASFEWVDDFSAARNHAFGLATAKWRAYLDADDVIPLAGKLRPEVERLERERPEVNCLVLPYQYDPNAVQDEHRVFRWEDGWEWRDPIHEHCERTSGARMMSAAKWLIVEHRPADRASHSVSSFRRNYRIATAAHERAVAAGDLGLAATMAYYLGRDEAALALEAGLAAKVDVENWIESGDGPQDAQALLQSAMKRYDFVKATMPFSNFAALAAVEQALIFLDTGQPENAALIAAEALAHAPELPEGYLVLGVAHERRGDHGRAILAFETGWGKPAQTVFRTINDASLTEGIARISAAKSYVVVGQIDRAEDCLNRIPQHLLGNTRREYGDLVTAIMKQKGLVALKNYLDYLCWDTQGPVALRVIDEALPAALDGHPAVATMRREIAGKIKHLESWDAYRDTYASIPDGSSEDEGAHLLSLGRAKALIEWAKDMARETVEAPASGYGNNEQWAKYAASKDKIKLLSVGSLNGIIERKVLDANPRIHLTIADASSAASKSTEALIRDFPGRVNRHVMEAGFYDWYVSAATEVLHPSGRGLYDCIACFEVLEHLPDPKAAVRTLAEGLREGGTLFLSTPVADHWVEPYLTGPEGPGVPEHKVWWHVQGWSPQRLEALLRGAGLEGRLDATDGGAVFLARRTKRRGYTAADLNSFAMPREGPSLAIHVGSTPTPFDADTLSQKHLGGSEEAVTHLAAALAGRGARVTVYAPRPRRDDGVVVHADKGVLWRAVEDFDPAGDAHDAVFFWRHPLAALDVNVKKGRYKKILWLHDAQYGAPQKAYDAFDRVIVLSEFHAQTIAENDKVPVFFVDRNPTGYSAVGDVTRGLACKANFELASNGIDPAAFPVLTAEVEAARDPFKVVYGSSPDRGLEHLMSAWPAVKAAVPQATLDVYYSWELLDRAQPLVARKLRMRAVELESLGLTLKGGVSQPELHRAYSKASVWAYFSQFPEISCITAMKALACGLTCVTSRFGAVDETLGPHGTVPIGDYAPGSAEWVMGLQCQLIDALKNPPTLIERSRRQDWAFMQYEWRAVARRFMEIAQ